MKKVLSFLVSIGLLFTCLLSAGVAETSAVVNSSSAEAVTEIRVKSVQINEKYVSVVVGGKEEAAKAQLTVTIMPEDATVKSGVWSSSNVNVAVVDSDGVVTGINPGNANIVFTSDDPSNPKKAQIAVKVGQAVTAINLPENEVVYVNKTLALKPEVLPKNATNKKVEYISSDPSVATVTAAGQVKGVANGEAVITCKAIDGSDISASVNVKVFQPVQSLKLDKTKLNAFAGKTSDPLVVSIAPADALYQDVTWTSSDESIATVNDKGEVTGIAGGKVEITATSIEPVSGNAKPKSVKCQVTVSQAVEYIWLEKNEAKSTEKKLVLTTTILPDTASNKKLKWTSSNTKVATVKGGVVTFKKHEGESIITATAEDGSGIYGSCKVSVGFSGAVLQIGNYIRRAGSYVWSVDSFDGNGSLEVLKDSLNANGSKDKSEMSEVELLLTTNREEIIFRDIPWGSTIGKVRASIKFKSFGGNIYADGSGRDIDEDSIDDEEKVADHKIEKVICRSAFDVDENGKVTNRDKFYYAQYELLDDDQKSVSEDIEKKLIDKYGEPDKNFNGQTLVWYGVNNTRLTYTKYGIVINITYEWLDGIKLRAQAEEAYEREVERKTYSDSNEGL